MGKHAQRSFHGDKKEFAKILQSLCYSRQIWEVWSDVITAMACSIANAVDRSPDRFERREKEYAMCMERLGGVEKPAQLLDILVDALEADQEQDFLGEMYMNLNLGNHWKGQFFTPYNVSRIMAEMTMRDVSAEIDRRGYLSICDPACGAGSTLIAAANTLHRQREDFQHHVLFVGQDLDRVVGLMCYIQLSLLGCAGYICIGNSLTNPMAGHVLFPEEKKGQEIWLMPMFLSQIWNGRRQIHIMDAHLKQAEKLAGKKVSGYTFFFDFNEKEVTV